MGFNTVKVPEHTTDNASLPPTSGRGKNACKFMLLQQQGKVSPTLMSVECRFMILQQQGQVSPYSTLPYRYYHEHSILSPHILSGMK